MMNSEAATLAYDDDDTNDGQPYPDDTGADTTDPDYSEGEDSETNDVSINSNSHPSTELVRSTAELMQQNDPCRMQLTRQEYQWALDVKKAIEGIPDLDPLSDFWYAQIALVSQGDTNDAVDRAYKFQEHKKENDIRDTLEDGLCNLPKEATFLSIDFNLQTGGYIIAYDMTKSDGSIWRSPSETCYFNRRSFYASQMAFCDFAALRTGLTVLVECEGYKLIKGKSIDLSSFRSQWKKASGTPQRMKQVKFFNNPQILTMMAFAAKASLPKDFTDKFQFGAKCPLGRLDNLYGLPTPEIAKARLQSRMIDLLQRRYHNEKSFRLQQDPPRDPLS